MTLKSCSGSGFLCMYVIGRKLIRKVEALLPEREEKRQKDAAKKMEMSGRKMGTEEIGWGRIGHGMIVVRRESRDAARNGFIRAIAGRDNMRVCFRVVPVNLFLGNWKLRFEDLKLRKEWRNRDVQMWNGWDDWDRWDACDAWEVNIFGRLFANGVCF